MKTKDLEARIEKLESTLSDTHKLLEVMNDRITHNAEGIELMTDSSGDQVNDTWLIEDSGDAVEAIKKIDSLDDNSFCTVLEIAYHTGKELNNWDEGFGDVLSELWLAAHEEGFNPDNMLAEIGNAMQYGYDDPSLKK